jgi:hypothetical protein
MLTAPTTYMFKLLISEQVQCVTRIATQLLTKYVSCPVMGLLCELTWLSKGLLFNCAPSSQSPRVILPPRLSSRVYEPLPTPVPLRVNVTCFQGAHPIHVGHSLLWQSDAGPISNSLSLLGRLPSTDWLVISGSWSLTTCAITATRKLQELSDGLAQFGNSTPMEMKSSRMRHQKIS